MEINNIKLQWLGHDGFCLITKDNKVIYIDPYKIAEVHHKKTMRK